MVWLLDGNLLTALAISSHAHHARALDWFYAQPRRFATCSVTEGTLLRLHMMSAPDPSAAAAWTTLGQLRQMQGHEFWLDGFSYEVVHHHGLKGHRQVTDRSPMLGWLNLSGSAWAGWQRSTAVLPPSILM